MSVDGPPAHGWAATCQRPGTGPELSAAATAHHFRSSQGIQVLAQAIAGVDMVREIVGHSDIEVTMTIYAHTSLDEKRRALGKLGDALA